MAGQKKADGGKHKKPIDQYEHKDKKRVNNPPVGLVTAATEPPKAEKKTYAYDPHLDPQLVWAGKAEHTSFEVPTVSLHVHERIDSRTIIEAVRKRNGNGNGGHRPPLQGSLFESRGENPPLREAIDFYKHAHNWSNRLIAGDSLLVMNSLLEKEGMAGQVQMVYMDPPYGIEYFSNFQPFVKKSNVKDGKDEDLTQEPEMIRAFRDTWELDIHSYLTYLRDRLWLAKELLNESGSCFVQISDKNLHYVRVLMEEVFGSENFEAVITFRKTNLTFATGRLGGVCDYLVWYAKDSTKKKYRQLYVNKEVGGIGGTNYGFVELIDGTRRRMTAEEKRQTATLPIGSRVFSTENLMSSGATESCIYDFEFEGRNFTPVRGKSWKTHEAGLRRLAEVGRLKALGEDRLYFVTYFDEYPVTKLTNAWYDTRGEMDLTYVVQTAPAPIQRCLLMTTDPGDLVFDPTCGSGTTAHVAEEWGRRWITCDTSRIAVTLAKQRLATTLYDYYELAHPVEGVGSGFRYKTVPHITLGSIANMEPPGEETLYDEPSVDSSKARVSGPFTVEAVPAPTVRALAVASEGKAFGPGGGEAAQIRLDGTADPQQVRLASRPTTADASIARSGESLRQSEWRDVLLQGGVRGKGGQVIQFSRVEPLGGTR